MGMKSLLGAGRAVGLVAATGAMVLLGAAPAFAAAPSHDTIDNAKVITAVPFSDVVDTTEATSDAEDEAIKAQCGAPITNGSVWYSVVGSETATAYVVDASQSDFPVGVIVATGTPGNLQAVACGQFSFPFPSVPSRPFYIMAFSFDPAVNGGQLSISVDDVGPPPEVALTVDDVGRVNRTTGTATISGTYTCTGDADSVSVQGQLQQQQGNTQVVGFFLDIGLTCGGTFPWSVEVIPSSGRFVRGLAATLSTVAGCNAIDCDFVDTLEVIHLKGRG
jgi:hypothetical protein